MKLNMYVAVLEICKKHEVEWSDIPKFVEVVDRLQLSINEINALALLHAGNTTVVSSYKTQKLSELYTALAEVHGVFRALATDMNDPGLFLKNSLSVSRIKRMNGTTLKTHIAQVAEDLIASGNVLEPFGIDNTRIGEILQIIEESTVMLSKVRKTIIERKTMTKSLDVQTAAIDLLVREQLDNLVRLQKRHLPEFFDEYFNARQIIHYRGKKASGDDPLINTAPTEPDDGF